MRKNEIPEHGDHEWVSAALQEEVDPVLEPAASRELHAEDFVLGKNQKKTTH